MSAIKWILFSVVASGLASDNGFVERDLHVLVVSASATQVNQVRIERNFPTAAFFYGEEDTPRRGAESSAGRLSLLNESDNDPTVSVRFKISSGLHELSMGTAEFIDTLNQVRKPIAEGVYMASDKGTPLDDLKLVELEGGIQSKQFFLLPRTLLGSEGDPQWEYPPADTSVLVYFGSGAEIAKKLSLWSVAITGNNGRPTAESWRVGAAAFAEHYSVATVRIDLTERKRLAPSAAQTIGEFALVSHRLQTVGALVLPRLGWAPEDTQRNVRLPLVHKKDHAIQGFEAPAEQFISELIRPSVLRLNPNSVLECYPHNSAEGSSSACVEDSQSEGGYKIVVGTGSGTEKRVNTFYMRSAQDGVERRWKVDITFTPEAPVLGDREIFPITTATDGMND